MPWALAPGSVRKSRPRVRLSALATPVEGDRANLYFECLWVDKTANKIAAHTNSDDTLIRLNGAWLIKEMKAAVVPEL
jgi:hypothetical protein